MAPCFDCGWDPGELEHLADGKPTYTEVLAFGIPIVVCNFCLVDFSSYDPAYVNRPAWTKLGLGEFVEVRAITNPSQGEDKFCPGCRRRLAFLKFLAKVRASDSDRVEVISLGERHLRRTVAEFVAPVNAIIIGKSATASTRR